MRPKRNTQVQFNFQPSNLELTNRYYAKYEEISRILDASPQLVDLIHADLAEPLDEERDVETQEVRYRCATETVMRLVVAQVIEGGSLREIIVRVDDSHFLRRFVRVYNDPMIDYTTFCRLRNRITPQTWSRVHGQLTRWAIDQEAIDGTKLRVDTTAVETNIHWPTDSSLLWDTYRTLGRLINRLREVIPKLVGTRRLQIKKVKRLYTRIARIARRKERRQELKSLYFELIQLVAKLLRWCDHILVAVQRRSDTWVGTMIEFQPLTDQIAHYRQLGQRVLGQAWRRTIEEMPVPNEEKIFSIFEPHTELLKRGKAVRNIEFGHMIELRQVEGCFITGYSVFDQKPSEPDLLKHAVAEHCRLFGKPPKELTADRGYYDAAVMAQLAQKVDLLAIAKKGKRTVKEKQQEHDPLFRHAQRFRAGIEGSISFLKRVLGLARCYSKGWTHYATTIAATIVAHNLLVLARD